MKKTLSFLSLLFLLIAFQACKSDDEMQTPVVNNKYYTTTNDINILKEDAMQYIQENVINDSLIVFSSNTPEDALPQVGANLYVPVSFKTPYGMLVKVLSIDKGSTVKVQTEALPLEDAFEYLSVDTTLSVITELDGVFDKDGNPIEYEIVDTAEINNPNIEDTVQVKNVSTRASFTSDWNWKKECLKFPIKLYKGNSGKDKITVNGMVYVGFDKFDLDIDVNKFKVNYINLDATPYIKLAAESTVTTESKIELEDRIGQLRFKVTVPTPIGVPVIVPITLYMYGTCGIKGELSAKLGLQYKYNCNCVATYKNGQWTSKATHGGFDNKSPWIVSEFDVKGEIYSGARLGLLAGLYSATTGIGFNVTPNFSLSAEAKLASPNLLKANPEVGLNLLVGGDVYCVAEIFGKKLGKYSLKFPDYTLWSTKMYLLPNIENFTATGASSSADISWSHNGLYFLEPLGIKTGTTIFEDDKITERVSYTPSPTSKNNMGYCTYNVTATNLNSGSTYYAAPFASWKDFKWYGDKEEITTEANYNLGFRCANHDYDVISFNFSLNNTSGNTIDYTTEAQDYDGSPMRVHITGKYNSSTKTLDGIFDFYFYNDPNQQRKDGFSVSLATDDSGYVDCSKVVDNGGCYAALRIYKSSNRQAARRKYNKVLVEDDCNVGIFNKNYAK